MRAGRGFCTCPVPALLPWLPVALGAAIWGAFFFAVWKLL